MKTTLMNLTSSATRCAIAGCVALAIAACSNSAQAQDLIFETFTPAPTILDGFDSANDGLTGLVDFNGDLTIESESGNDFASLTQNTGAGNFQFRFFGAGVISAGQEYQLSFDARQTELGTGGIAAFEVFSEAAVGATNAGANLFGGLDVFGVDAALLTPDAGNSAITSDFQTYNFTGFFGADVSRGFTLQFIANSAGGTGETTNLQVDNVRFTAIPEPSSFAFIGLAGLALIGRRRK